jgi:hypothetical protein
MLRHSLVFALILSLPTQARSGGGPDYCADCVLGLFDEPGMLNNFGDIIPFSPKNLGFKVAPPVQGLALIEFSISGLRQAEDGILVLSVDGVTNPLPTIILGVVQAPVDTTPGSSQAGGMDVAWSACIVGSQALLRIQILTFAPIPDGKRLAVLHRFPPANPAYGLEHPIIDLCDSPNFTAVLVRGGDYILNPVVRVEGETWSGIKKLYR